MSKQKSKRQNKQNKFIISIKTIRSHWKWHYLLWITILLLAVIFIMNFSKAIHWMNQANWVLIKDYLAILLTWPVAILILGLIFIYQFRSSIRVFLEKIDHFKAPGVELSQQQATTQFSEEKQETETVENLESKVNDGIVTLNKEQVAELVNIIETLDFKFLNLHLVQNTKNALQMITQIEAQKSTFLQTYLVPPQVANVVAERQSILNALTEAGLIENDGSILKITEKGLRFLTFIGLQAGSIR